MVGYLVEHQLLRRHFDFRRHLSRQLSFDHLPKCRHRHHQVL
jgi:hypothetical protein